MSEDDKIIELASKDRSRADFVVELGRLIELTHNPHAIRLLRSARDQFIETAYDTHDFRPAIMDTKITINGSTHIVQGVDSFIAPNGMRFSAHKAMSPRLRFELFTLGSVLVILPAELDIQPIVVTPFSINT